MFNNLQIEFLFVLSKLKIAILKPISEHAITLLQNVYVGPIAYVENFEKEGET